MATDKINVNEIRIIITTAVFSRLLLIFLQYVSNVILADHEADAFRYVSSADDGLIDKFIKHCIGGLLRWDAQHFMHIARYGYTYEHNLAFFPFYPILVRYITLILGNFMFLLNIDSLTLIIFLVVNVLCFILSAICLYKLSVLVVGKNLAYKSTLLFCYNPSSIFFTAPYTECIFSYLTFKSMLNCVLLYKKYSNIPSHFQFKDVPSIIPICLGVLTRSNGILNIGFLVYTLLCLYLRKVNLKEHIVDKIFFSVRFIITAKFLTLICVLPFILYQVYSYKMFCTDFKTHLPHIITEQAEKENFVLPGTFSQYNQSWCWKKIPLAYSYVQSYYWKVGFLQYYELKQIPNFILAFPIIIIIIHGTYKFFKQSLKYMYKIFSFDLIFDRNVSQLKFNPVMAIFVIHALVLTIFCLLNIHVQVITRMLCSASPILYWFSSSYISDSSENNLFKKLFCGKCSCREYCILCYFLSYFIVGTIMFSNFLPWT